MHDTHNIKLHQTSIAQTSELVDIPLLHIYTFGSPGKHNLILDDGLLDCISKRIRFLFKQIRIHIVVINYSGPFFSVFPPRHYFSHHDITVICSSDGTQRTELESIEKKAKDYHSNCIHEYLDKLYFCCGSRRSSHLSQSKFAVQFRHVDDRDFKYSSLHLS